MLKKYLLLAYLILHLSLYAETSNESKVIWDEWNVPHIIAENDSVMFYLLGKVQMKLHGNLLLKKYGEARGKGAEYWSKQYLSNDLMIKRLDIPNRSKRWLKEQDEQNKTNIKAFIKGINDFAEENPDQLNDDNKVVLPVVETDPLSLLQYSYHYKVGAFQLQSKLEQWKNAGSNAWAIAPSKSESGNSMLLIQPHPPWTDDYKFFEVHMKSNNFNIYGISLIGSMTIAMGFNEYMGWGLTFNQADTYDLYEIEVENNTYMVEGKKYEIELRREEYSYKENGKLFTGSIICKKTIHGYVVEEKDQKVIALRLSGLDRPNMMNQFLEMAKSKNSYDFENAISELQLPLQNIVYADRYGKIGYIYNGIIPKRNIDNYGYWTQIQNGNESKNLVDQYLTYEELPKFTNPASGFISNTNNPPFTSTYPPVLKPEDYPGYIAPRFFDNRTERSLRILVENEKLSFDDLERIQNDSQSELANKCIDQLIYYSSNSGKQILKEAARVLRGWDKTTSIDSKGSVLFAQWYFLSKDNLFQSGSNPNEPFNGNNDLTDFALENILTAAEILKNKYGRLDIKWGDVYKIYHAGKLYPSGIGLNELGSFKAGFYRPGNEGKFMLLGGVAYSLIVEFADKVKAKAVLPYGNSTESPDDKQLELLNNGVLREILFYEEDLKSVDQSGK